MDALELQSLLSSLFDFVEATIRHVVDKRLIPIQFCAKALETMTTLTGRARWIPMLMDSHR